MHDGFCTIPLSRGNNVSLIVRPTMVSAIFWSDDLGRPASAPTPDELANPDSPCRYVAMLVPGCGDYAFFVDFSSPEEARGYLNLHRQDDNLL